jgi:hypothetical protein
LGADAGLGVAMSEYDEGYNAGWNAGIKADWSGILSDWGSRLAMVGLAALLFGKPLTILGNNIGAMLDRPTSEHYAMPVICNVTFANNIFSGADSAIRLTTDSAALRFPTPEWAKLKQEIYWPTDFKPEPNSSLTSAGTEAIRP